MIAAGYDCFPVLWSHDDQGKLTYINKLDQKEKKAGGEYMRYVCVCVCMYVRTYMYECTVEPPNKGHLGISHFVLCLEVVLFSEVKKCTTSM